jgi:hypothetical protein
MSTDAHHLEYYLVIKLLHGMSVMENAEKYLKCRKIHEECHNGVRCTL